MFFRSYKSLRPTRISSVKGSANGRTKDMVASGICEILSSIAMFGDGGVLVFAKMKGIGKSKVEYKTVEVMFNKDLDKFTFTMDGKSDSPLGIGQMLSRSGFDGLSLVHTFKARELSRDPDSSDLNGLTFYTLLKGTTSYVGSLKVKIRGKVQSKMVVYTSRGGLRIAGRKPIRSDKKIQDWCAKHVIGYKVPTSLSFLANSNSGTSFGSMISIAQKSSIPISSKIVWAFSSKDQVNKFMKKIDDASIVLSHAGLYYAESPKLKASTSSVNAAIRKSKRNPLYKTIELAC